MSDSFSRTAAWVITEEGQMKVFAADGHEVGLTKEIRVLNEVNNYPSAEIRLIVNLGSRKEMEECIAKNKML